jgi:hypothetical protein
MVDVRAENMADLAESEGLDVADRLGGVRRTVRVPPSGRSMVRVSSAAWIVTVWWAWTRPRAIFCPTTITIPLLAGPPLHLDRLPAGAARPHVHAPLHVPAVRRQRQNSVTFSARALPWS